ncbi:hypothetical protein SCUCBS95973_001559 [Sporothrix curviconia]|uniref:FAM86A protein n=1 Tax=Sporothrix curviconia TaxID=1260050 RepID=A0ABP0B083_9PEZI
MIQTHASDVRQMTTSPEVQRFCRQCLQAEPSPEFPGPELLKVYSVQEHLYDEIFARNDLPPSYALRVLKALVAQIEASIDDWEEYAVSDNLLQCLANFRSASQTGALADATKKSPVVYYVSALEEVVANSNSNLNSNTNTNTNTHPTPTITLLENRATIAAGGTTGIRTWEAAMHLGAYLCQHPDLVRGKRVLELGAGTGYIAALCAKFLGTAACVATDGSPEVVNSLPDNLELNGQSEVLSKELAWGPSPPDDWANWAGDSFDTILGADITFDARDMPDLLATIRWCLGGGAGGERDASKMTQKTVLIAATERNKRTFDTFIQLASESFDVEDVAFPVPSRAQQTGPFYSDAVPIHICLLQQLRS